MNKFPVYIHMEKCGGMSLHHALLYALPGYQVLKPWWYWSNEPGCFFGADEFRILKKFHPKLSGIGGHTTRSFAGYENIVSKPIFYFTFLRDPITRYLSHLNHQVNKMGVDWTVDAFLKEARFNNLMTRRIGGCDDLELAKSRLRNDFGMVGLFESYDQSLVMLSDLLFDKPDMLRYEHMNDSERETKITFNSLSSSQKKQVLENNALDIDLYEYARDVVFQLQVHNCPLDLDNSVSRFKEINAAFQYNIIKRTFLKFSKKYSELLPQAFAHKLSK